MPLWLNFCCCRMNTFILYLFRCRPLMFTTCGLEENLNPANSISMLDDVIEQIYVEIPNVILLNPLQCLRRWHEIFY